MLPLFIDVLHSYLVGMKRRTGRCFTCKSNNSYFLHYLKNPSIMPLGIFLVLYFSEKIKLGIFCELPAKQTIHIKCQVFFFSKKTIKKLKDQG